ncbi:uroporphyrinogen-III synthase [Prevotella sp. HUN102]|uniref:uroporphyrinogen-III synthase n=1 Tax=Prevotella sp. HUN102 TaxID=1392486 RepID=UPI0004901201|nr:uroporphyrinogen-III synthase [Prevotella sp. HUN102]
MKRTYNILVTAPKGYSKRFCDALRTASREGNIVLDPIAIPLIATEIFDADDATNTLIGSLNSFDYVIFTSRKAIEAMARFREKAPFRFSDTIGYASIGKDVEYMKSALNLPPCFANSEPSLMGIAKELEKTGNHIGKRVAVLGPRVEGIREPSTVPDFIASLRHIDTKPTFISVYKTCKANATALNKVRHAITSKIDCVAFTSGAEAQVYRELMEGLPVNKKEMKPTLTACFGPYTAKCAEEEGLQIDFISKDFGSFEAFATNLKSYLSSL